MKISRENYEIWFTDWLDNSLSDSQVGELEIFLDKNPDLREEFMILSHFSLKPGSAPFPFKDRIKRSPADLSAEQFDLLCAACQEKDLLPEQEVELLELIRSDTQKQKNFELVGRMKLVPPEVVFPHKNRLLKKTAAARIIRLAAVSLSAAAIIAVVLLTGVFTQDSFTPEVRSNVAANVPEMPVPQAGNTIAESIRGSSPARQTIEKSDRGKQPESAGEQISEKPLPDNDVVTSGTRVPVEIEKIAFNSFPAITAEPGNSLIEIGTIPIPASEYDDRTRIGKFIAQTFREKILKDKTPQDSPLKGYEIAEAGIEGLNWLFGWEMALSRNNDANGNVKSVNFSSRAVKFQAPVKNNEIAE